MGFLVPPKAPGKPSMDPVDVNNIKVTWTKPGSDGGSKVLHYILQKRSLNDCKWITLNDPIDGFEVIVGELEEGKVYEFRVAAVSLAGQGPFSDVAKSHNGKTLMIKSENHEKIVLYIYI